MTRTVKSKNGNGLPKVEQSRMAGASKSLSESLRTLQSELRSSDLDVGTEIQRIVEIVTNLAERTNRLALNTLIDGSDDFSDSPAASIVIEDIEDLSQETAESVDGIVIRVQALESEIVHAVDCIGQVGDIVGRIGDLQAAISRALALIVPAEKVETTPLPQAPFGVLKSHDVKHAMTRAVAELRATNA